MNRVCKAPPVLLLCSSLVRKDRGVSIPAKSELCCSSRFGLAAIHMGTDVAGRSIVRLVVMMAIFVNPLVHWGGHSSGSASAFDLGEGRVWRAGGTPEKAQRGKCWIDGTCASGSMDHRSSRDDDEDAYRSCGSVCCHECKIALTGLVN